MELTHASTSICCPLSLLLHHGSRFREAAITACRICSTYSKSRSSEVFRHSFRVRHLFTTSSGSCTIFLIRIIMPFFYFSKKQILKNFSSSHSTRSIRLDQNYIVSAIQYFFNIIGHSSRGRMPIKHSQPFLSDHLSRVELLQFPL